MHPVRTVPTDEMHPVGTDPTDKMHTVGTLTFVNVFQSAWIWIVWQK